MTLNTHEPIWCAVDERGHVVVTKFSKKSVEEWIAVRAFPGIFRVVRYIPAPRRKAKRGAK